MKTSGLIEFGRHVGAPAFGEFARRALSVKAGTRSAVSLSRLRMQASRL